MKKNYSISIVNGSSYETSLNETIQVGGKEAHIQSISEQNGEFAITIDGIITKAEVLSANFKEKKFTILIQGKKYKVEAANEFDLLLKKMGLDASSSQKVKELKAPMPGMVLNIPFSEGDQVTKGDTLLVLEAMKMENSIKSPGAGKIKQILAQKGRAVEKNQVLIIFE